MTDTLTQPAALAPQAPAFPAFPAPAVVVAPVAAPARKRGRPALSEEEKAARAAAKASGVVPAPSVAPSIPGVKRPRKAKEPEPFVPPPNTLLVEFSENDIAVLDALEEKTGIPTKTLLAIGLRFVPRALCGIFTELIPPQQNPQ
jgi:hypothetical protein